MYSTAKWTNSRIDKYTATIPKCEHTREKYNIKYTQKNGIQLTTIVSPCDGRSEKKKTSRSMALADHSLTQGQRSRLNKLMYSNHF